MIITDFKDNDSLFDEMEFQSESFQRVLKYLDAKQKRKWDKKGALELVIRYVRRLKLK